jgi:hypothetical protein
MPVRSHTAAISLRPDDAAEWTQHMRRGDFESAWCVSDRLLRERAGTSCAHLPRHFQWIWNGTPIDGARVLVRCYHGLGDTIQFARYLPLLRARAREVIVWAQPALIPLLRGVAGIDRLIALHDGDPGVAADVDVELMELPYVFRTTLDMIPAAVPYIDVQAEPVTRPHGAAVGLVWRAGDWAEHRSIPFASLAPLLQRRVTWYVLQGEPGVDECPADFGIRRGTRDLLEAARVIRSLDLLVTIDSMAAHLAGALATPVWTLLPQQADWRWMEHREDSPWYPTMRLFRQSRRDDWTDVIDRVAAELERDVHSASGGAGFAAGSSQHI